ncbi:MAG: SAF domain-containing protein [Microthrixaceae bacterium]
MGTAFTRRTDSDGAGGSADRPEPTRPARRLVPAPRAVVGAALVVAAAAGVLAAHRGAEAPGRRYTVALRPVTAGAVLSPADLGTIELDLPGGIPAVPADRARGLVGRTAMRDLAAMDLLRPADTRAGDAGTATGVEVVVGVDPVRLPGDLRVGTPVDVLVTDPEGSGTTVAATAARVLAEVDPERTDAIGGSGQLPVRLVVPDGAVATTVADAAARGRITLVAPRPAPGGGGPS